MGRAVANAKAAGSLHATALAVFFLAAFSAGCGNSCVAFFSDPSEGTLSISTDTCSIKNQETGNVRLRFSPSPDSAKAWRKAGIQQIFLTLREIDARSKPDSGDDSPAWYDLAPNLKQQPVQIDLLAETDDASPRYLIDRAKLPAGAYTQIRIFLMSDQAGSGVSLPPENLCGTTALNCVLTRDGNVHSLRLRAEPILIDAGQPTTAVLYVLRDTTSNLDLQFIPGASQIYALGQAAWFDPSLNARWTFSSPSTDPAIAVLPH